VGDRPRGTASLSAGGFAARPAAFLNCGHVNSFLCKSPKMVHRFLARNIVLTGVESSRSMFACLAPAPHVRRALVNQSATNASGSSALPSRQRTNTRQVTGSLKFFCSILHVILSSSRRLSGPSCRFHRSYRSRDMLAPLLR
jgi:hypothetical protein